MLTLTAGSFWISTW